MNTPYYCPNCGGIVFLNDCDIHECESCGWEGLAIETPNPGSSAAKSLGCTCAVMDNAHGKGFHIGGHCGKLFYINEDCPIHGTKTC
jgi:hypothetical protein